MAIRTDREVADKLRSLEDSLKLNPWRDAQSLRTLARSLEPDYVRQVGRESMVQAAGKSRNPLTERIPESDSESLVIEMNWQQPRKHWWQRRGFRIQGILHFQYDPREHSYRFEDLHYVGHCGLDRSS